MKNRVKTAFFLLSLFCFLTSAVTVKAEYSVKINQIDTSKFPEIKAYISVVDDSNKPVKGLFESNFTITEDGIPGPTNFTVESMLRSGEPIAVVLAIDTSGSMKGQAMEHAREAALKFVEGLGDNDLAAVVDFNDKEHIISEFTSDKESLKRAIEGLDVAGTKTALYDAIYKALEIGSRPGLPFRKVIIILSDGKDEGSVLTIDDGITRAKDSSIPVYTIGLGPNVDRKPLMRVSRLTGGEALFAPTSSDLVTLYDAISEQLKNQYILTYVTTALTGDGLQHTLGLSVSIGDSIFKDDRTFISPKVSPPTTAWNWTWFWIAVAGLVVLIIILIIVIVSQKRKSKGEGAEAGEYPPDSDVMDDSMTVTGLAAGGVEEGRRTMRGTGAAYPADKTVIMKAEEFLTAWIEITKGPDKGKSFNLKEERTKIGRTGANDISLSDDTISREHAVIDNEDGRYRLTDLASTNGTFVDGKKVSTRVIKDSDKIGFGDTEAIIRIVKSKG
ncbi:MAG: VWA domain-containing protein [Deltaproteobacteria bacterium]|uniref:VWA domain-containing protein n=1 Tax=Candidatus Zymogenus saltonus TaxID=2844893 RepID=A0A9D8KG35_9DELT|nr:VWA domain-containing protein [Candidatus Zymogenus saltonus]